MDVVKLNLTRKLRAKNFDQIVGQSLSVRMLKNSLYLGHYFPVYLFSGQKGCGKTTTARVFAAALNCEALELFRKNPKAHSLPCLVCKSCAAMISGTHPDFIEMDAASHTGVDNVRQIIDAASLLPVMGNKKIYLIDEAHMLSKAAFNALLKILEEPPVGVVFILATTDPQKIIETVKSRCFQLLFKAVEEPALLCHLQQVCGAEKIPYEDAALSLIIHETNGSVRDALNIIEQVRFSHTTVTKTAVLRVLDHWDTDSFIRIIELIFAKNVPDMLQFLQDAHIEQFSADHIWRRFIELVRALLWLKYGVTPNGVQDCAKLEEVAHTGSLADITTILHYIHSNEDIFYKTTSQHLFLELFFIQLCQHDASSDTGTNSGNKGGGNSSVPPQNPARARHVEQEPEEGLEDSDGDDSGDQEDLRKASSTQQQVVETARVSTGMQAWEQFLGDLAKQGEPLIHSILSQGVYQEQSTQQDTVLVQLPKELAFFESVLQESSKTWAPCLQRAYFASARLVMQFTGESRIAPVIQKPTVERPVAKKTEDAKPEHKKTEQKASGGWAGRDASAYKRTPVMDISMVGMGVVTGDGLNHPDYAGDLGELSGGQPGGQIDISDKERWKTIHMVLNHFPGTVREVRS
jgi:DNA polymerase III subunit gamma/tau